MIFETVAVINGIPRHVRYHQERLDRSREVLGLGADKIDLAAVIQVPDDFRQGLVRCRIDVAQEVLSIKFAQFKPAPVRNLIVVDADISYEHKWGDRAAFERLRAENAEYDDVIITRQGLVTDSTMANLAFFKDEAWYTPLEPLLPGTTRARLIESGVLHQCVINREQIAEFQKVVLINALRGFNPEAAIEIERIHFAA